MHAISPQPTQNPSSALLSTNPSSSPRLSLLTQLMSQNLNPQHTMHAISPQPTQNPSSALLSTNPSSSPRLSLLTQLMSQNLNPQYRMHAISLQPTQNPSRIQYAFWWFLQLKEEKKNTEQPDL